MPVSELRAGDPDRIGPYRVLGRLGAGGMGVVYLVQVGKGLAALKLIRPQLADDEEFRARFRREVEAGRAVSGPYTARFIDAQLDGPAPYLVTEYVDGPSLAEAVTDAGPFSFEAVVGLASGLAQALRAIHATGVIHRDLKPSNILIGPTGPRIIDFGIARAMEGTSVTRTGMSVGSPSWMAPEAARGEPVSQATDVFAWGSVVMFAATGRGPFGEGRAEAILYRIVHEEPNLSGLDARLVPVVRAALARDPGSRPSSSQLIEALSEALAGGDPDPAEIGTAVRTRTDLLLAEDRPDITTPVVLTSPRRKRGAIAAAAIIGLAAVGGAAILTGGFGTQGHRGVLRTTTTTRSGSIIPTTSAPTTSTTSTTSAPTTSTTSTSTTTTVAAFAGALPVVECPSVYGAGPAPPSKYPSSIAVSLPGPVAKQLSYYSDSTRSVLPILAPSGWNCSAGVGADGSVGVDVFPSGTSNKSSSFARSDAQGVYAHAIPGCQGCISETACPLVPAAVEGSLSLYSPCPYKRPRAEEVRWAMGSPNTPASDYTYDVVYFTDPPGVAGDGDPSGGPFTARGVLLFTNGPDIFTSASIETCTLPTHLAGLCTPILKDFSKREGQLSTS